MQQVVNDVVHVRLPHGHWQEKLPVPHCLSPDISIRLIGTADGRGHDRPRPLTAAASGSNQSYLLRPCLGEVSMRRTRLLQLFGQI